MFLNITYICRFIRFILCYFYLKILKYQVSATQNQHFFNTLLKNSLLHFFINLNLKMMNEKMNFIKIKLGNIKYTPGNQKERFRLFTSLIKSILETPYISDAL